METNALSKKFKFFNLLKFTFPSIIMMILMSIYTAVDGAFVGQMVSEDALSAINIVFPIFGVMWAIALMLATGSNAIIAFRLGEHRNEEARGFFTFIYILGIVVSLVLTLLILVFCDPLIHALGSTPLLDEYSRSYLLFLAPFIPFGILQTFTLIFFITAGKPNLGMFLTIAGGASNILFDYVFIGPLNMGIMGAALATGIGYCIPSIFGVVFFYFNRRGDLYFTKPCFTWHDLCHTLFNGSSELVGNLASAITTILFNFVMLKYTGEEGVAAITVVLYLQYVMASMCLGYSAGISPIISYKYGAADYKQLKYLVALSLKIIAVAACIIVGGTFLGSRYGVMLFISPDSPVFALANQGLLIFSLAFLFAGHNIFASALFTALGNGKISALISSFRSLIFISGFLLILPQFLGVVGAFLAVPLAEVLSFMISLFYFLRCKKKYNY